MKFDEWNLGSEVTDRLNNGEPTEFQQKAISALLGDTDALINSGDGEGRVDAIAVSVLEKIARLEDPEHTRVIILTPDAETVRQIAGQLESVDRPQISCTAVTEDGDREEQEEALNERRTVLVAQPVRLQELMKDNLFICRDVDLVVVDEADKMTSEDMTWSVERILKRVLSEHRTVIFAGELNTASKHLSEKLLDDPGMIGFEPGVAAPPTVPKDISQGFINVPNRMKISTLMAHIDSTPDEACVIFTASKRGTDRLYRIFRQRDLRVTSIHGKLSDEKREQRFSNFVTGDVQYLLVSEISALELKIDRTVQVINYDVPNDPDEYRFRANLVADGNATRVLSLVSKQDQNDINELRNELGQAPKELPLPDEVQEKLKERKSKKKSNGRGGGRQQKKESQKKRSGSRPSRSSRSSRGSSKKESGKKELQLPRPSYEKLSGGRSGNKQDEKAGVVEFFKKLFSS